jgi:hypothetical protein
MRSHFGFSALAAALLASPDALHLSALDMVSGFATAPGAGPTALTMAAGDSLTVRATKVAQNIRLLNFWNQNQVAGFGRLRSPRFSDNIQGIRALATVANTSPAMPMGYSEPLIAQDNLIAEIGGSAVGGQIESMSWLNWYDSDFAPDTNFIGSSDLKARAVKMVTVRTIHAFGAGGGYTGQVAINSTDDNAKNGKRYAVLGYKVSAQCCSIALRGVDTGNLRCGGPGTVALPEMTENWFMRLADEYGIKCIPTIDWANKFGIFVDGVQDQAAAAVTAQWYLVELS